MYRRFLVILARKLARAQAYVLTLISKEPIWVSTDGTPRTFREMTDRHVVNVIRLMFREGETKTRMYHLAQEEAKRRGLRVRFPR